MPWIPCPHNPKKLCADCKKTRRRETQKRLQTPEKRQARKERDAAYYAANKEKIIKRSAEWAAANPEKTRAAKQKYGKHGCRVRRGMVFDEGQTFDTMLLEQNNCCALCGELFEENAGRQAVIDHDHNTGKVRALLHRECNSGIGFLKDSAWLCLQGAEYLASFDTL